MSDRPNQKIPSPAVSALFAERQVYLAAYFVPFRLLCKQHHIIAAHKSPEQMPPGSRTPVWPSLPASPADTGQTAHHTKLPLLRYKTNQKNPQPVPGYRRKALLRSQTAFPPHGPPPITESAQDPESAKYSYNTFHTEA